ncbi:MAG: HD-like signal output (HDOD) protein [Pseudohongiellaceae bacterium]|jgi:HD-like signal output (HDOD) protein
MSDIGKKIKQDILSAIENDSIVLPTLPEIALDVREITENEDSSLFDLIEVINKDTALSARLLKVSNSPLFRGANEITNLNMAVNRLGMQYTSNLATGLVMEQMFQATSEMIDTRMRATWQRSTEVAGLCNVLARQHSHLAAGQATLAGLIYAIGALPVLKYVEDNDVQISSVMLDNLVDELQPIVGEKILEKWDFPTELRPIPVECVNFTRTGDKPDYADLVMVAMLQNYIGTDHHYLEMDWQHISAFTRMGIDPSIDPNEDEDLTAQMEAAMSLLT